MGAVQPRVAPRRHPPPPSPPVPPLPSAPSQAPAARPQLPCKRSRADAVAVAHGRKERVVDSCCPSSRLDQLELVLVDDDSGEEDDGCGSCVDGAGGAGGGQDDDEEESGSGGIAWRWSQESGGRGRRCSLWANGSRATEGGQLRAGGERDDEDPTVAAARRQEEDRKFWEACLASGYP